MKEDKNIYIKTLELGFERSKDGITYNECIEELKKQKFILSKDFESLFRFWFYYNFLNESTQVNTHLNAGYKTDLDSKKSFLSGEATIQYLDYIKLQESRKNAKNSSTTAIVAIIIATISIILQIISIKYC